MKLLTVLRARAIWMLRLDDLNPSGRALRDALAALTARYQFAVAPTPAEIQSARVNGEGVTFSSGIFAGAAGLVGVNLTFHPDGLIADTRSSTQDSDLFLDDLLTWLTADFDLISHTELLQRQVYVNEVHVTTKRTLSLLNPKLQNFARMIGATATGHDKPEFELAELQFDVDNQRPNKPAPFKFERAAGVPFNENRYYSGAPMQTDEHLRLLDALEELLSE